MDMFRVYYYTDDEIGIPWLGPDADKVEYCRSHGIRHPRFIWYEWPGFEVTTDPVKADVFVIRQRLKYLTQERIRSLRGLKGDLARRHVFFDLADNFEHYDLKGAISIRAAATHALVDRDPNIIAWPWPTDDFERYIPLLPGGFQHDVVFQGQVSTFAEMVLKSVENTKELNSHIQRNSRFFGHFKDPEQIASLRESYSQSMQRGRLALAPYHLRRESIRYRIYEAMSMARVSVLLCDRSVLPLADKIDWFRCLVQLPEQAAPNVGVILDNWLNSHSDREIVEMGQYARRMWEKWLWRGKWSEVIGMLIREKLEGSL